MSRSTHDDRGAWIVLRPIGRGNWKPIHLRVMGRHAPLPLLVHPGDRVTIAGATFRIVSVGSA